MASLARSKTSGRSSARFTGTKGEIAFGLTPKMEKAMKMDRMAKSFGGGPLTG